MAEQFFIKHPSSHTSNIAPRLVHQRSVNDLFPSGWGSLGVMRLLRPSLQHASPGNDNQSSLTPVVLSSLLLLLLPSSGEGGAEGGQRRGGGGPVWSLWKLA